MTSPIKVTVRGLLEDELDVVLRWALGEHWLVSEGILRASYQYDPSGWLAAQDDQGHVIGKSVFGFKYLNIEWIFFDTHNFIMHKP